MAALQQAGLRGEIVIVDDNSPDGTPAVCARLAEEHPVRLLVRETERGLSSAVVHGLHHARGDVLVVMDADLSHPPEKVPELVAALRDESVDFVIGSRYVQGGTTAEDWGVLRWLNSKVATLLAWPLTSAADPMAGFFALRRTTFGAARSLDPIGYKIGLELLVKTGCRSVKEVPIAFANRLHGTSKLTLKEQVNYLRHLKRLYEARLGRASRPLQFALVGSTGVVVDLACFALLGALVPLQYARALAIWVAMSWNYLLNRRLTFSDTRSQSPLRQYPLFCLSCLLGAVVNWSVSLNLVEHFELFQRWSVLAALCGIVAGTVFNYVCSRYLVFRLWPRRRPAPAKEVPAAPVVCSPPG
jgi:dolichol-phosphate mannosyltransferase